MDKEEIKYLLIKKGLKLVDVDKKHNLKYGTCKYALNLAHSKGEIAISKELNIPVQVLFPERYDKNSKRYRPQPSKNYNYSKREVQEHA